MMIRCIFLVGWQTTICIMFALHYIMRESQQRRLRGWVYFYWQDNKLRYNFFWIFLILQKKRQTWRNFIQFYRLKYRQLTLVKTDRNLCNFLNASNLIYNPANESLIFFHKIWGNGFLYDRLVSKSMSSFCCRILKKPCFCDEFIEQKTIQRNF